MAELPDAEQYAEQVLDQCERECRRACAQEHSNPVTRRLCVDACLFECYRQTQEV